MVTKTFEYLGVSSNDILSTKLMLVFFDNNDTLPIIERDILKGESNSYRPANYYGVKYKELELPIGICKEDGSSFTIEDREKIEDFIYSSDVPSDLTFYDINGKSSTFCGLFKSIEWRAVGKKIIGANLIFENKDPFWYKIYEEEASVSGSNSTWIIDCQSKVGYAYPILEIRSNLSSKQTIKIKNVDDEGKIFEANISGLDTIIFNNDCCKVMTGNEYADLGWENKDEIYWLRLKNGDNTLSITGSAELKITYKAKRRGLGSYFGDIFKPKEENTIVTIDGDTLILSGTYGIEGDTLIVYGTETVGETMMFN